MHAVNRISAAVQLRQALLTLGVTIFLGGCHIAHSFSKQALSAIRCNHWLNRGGCCTTSMACVTQHMQHAGALSTKATSGSLSTTALAPEPVAGDGFCAFGESALYGTDGVNLDCKPTGGSCVEPPPNREPGATCGGSQVGRCTVLRQPLQQGAPCECEAPYAGDDCSECGSNVCDAAMLCCQEALYRSWLASQHPLLAS